MLMNEQAICLQGDKSSIWEKRLKIVKIISLIVFVIALPYAVLLIILFFCPCFKSVLGDDTGLKNALSNLFIVLGIVNFTYPYVATARGTKLYGVNMSRVVYSQLKWYWYLYFVYAVLDILGLLYAGTSRPAGAWYCFVGMLIVMATTLYTAVTFIFKQHNSRFLIEAYLKDWINGKHGGDEACIYAGEYLRAYFLASQTVSVSVARALFAFLEKGAVSLDEASSKEGPPFILLSYSGQRSQIRSEGPDVVADSIFRSRLVFDRVFREMSVFEQTALLKQLLLILAEDFPDSKKNVHPVLCGLAAWLREGVTDRSSPNVWMQNWELLLDRLLRAGIFSHVEIPWKVASGYRAVLQRLVLLIQASALVDMTAIQFLEQEQFFNTYLKEKMDLISEHFDIPDGDKIDLYPWGQVIVQTAHDPDYDPDRSCVSSYAFLTFWEALRESENAEII